MSRVLRILGAAAVAAFFVSIYTPFWNYAGSLLAVPDSARKADAVVVLGAGLNGDGTLSDESLRRAVHGIRLFKQGLGETLIFAGPALRGGSGMSEAEVRRELAMDFEVPDGRIETIDHVLTTRDEATETASLLEANPSKTVLLVTEALHMRRAQLVFERAGLEVFPALSDNDPDGAFTPGARLELMRYVLSQAGAMLYYRIAGYI